VTPGSTVEDGYTFSGFSFTSSGTDPEVQITFTGSEEPTLSSLSVCEATSIGCPSSIVFTFIEPDSFWSTTTGSTYIPFPSSDTTGASFAVTGGIDPACTTCAVNISASITPTPEPRSLILLVAFMAALGLVVRHRKQSKTIS
jgi:hypothetical protein